ncbi:MAG: 30S ribosome-binding factor RbfA [Lactobacillus sp.]|nr:30S ribosome-binding factor RbfA [Lactobacillus sp.]
MKHRVGRVEAEILRELSKILQKKIRDPRLVDINLTAVDCTNDFSYATVYYSILSEDTAVEEDVAEGLEKAKGIMRHYLSEELTLFKVPELIFKRDTSVTYGSKIDKLIQQLHRQEMDR